MRTSHITHRPHGERCLECGARITRAQCGEGWCYDCAAREGLGGFGLLTDASRPYFCRTHRRRVRVDEHCRQWVTDK